MTFQPLNWVTGHPCLGLPFCQFSASYVLPFSTYHQARDRQTDNGHQAIMPRPFGGGSIHTLNFNGRFPGEPGCPLILLHLFLNCASFWDRPKLSMSLLTQSHQLFFRTTHLSNSFNLLCHTTFDPAIVIFLFNMSKPSQPTLSDHQTDWFHLLCSHFLVGISDKMTFGGGE